MELAKKLVGAFVVGGCMGLLGQLLMMLFGAIVGAESILFMPLILISMGVIGAVLFVLGIYQKIEKVGRIGALMSFCGLPTGVAGGICGIRGGGAPLGKAIANGLKPLTIIIGTAFIGSALIGVVASLLE